jgi:outer membrane biosynthesis protein TonB
MPPENHRRSFGLGAALSLSILLHALLALILAWLPPGVLGGERLRLVPDPPVELRFELASSAATTIPTDALSTPTPLPDEGAPIPSPPLDPARQEVAPPAQMPAESFDPSQDARRAPLESSSPAVTSEDALEPTREAAVQPSRRQLDLDRAVRELGRSLRDRPVETPGEAPGGARSNVYVPDVAALPTTGSRIGQLVFESRDFDWSDYGRQVYIAIWRAWHYRLWASTNDFEKWGFENREWILGHQVDVRFVIQRNGQVTGIEVEAPSVCLPLDRSATDALAEVILPPLPPAFPRDRETVHARFVIEGEIASMRPFLTRLKALGYF